MSFSGKISKRKNSGAVLLGTFMVPAAFSAASQNTSATKVIQDVAASGTKILNNQNSGSRWVLKILGYVILAGIIVFIGAALVYLCKKNKELQKKECDLSPEEEGFCELVKNSKKEYIRILYVYTECGECKLSMAKVPLDTAKELTDADLQLFKSKKTGASSLSEMIVGYGNSKWRKRYFAKFLVGYVDDSNKVHAFFKDDKGEEDKMINNIAVKTDVGIRKILKNNDDLSNKYNHDFEVVTEEDIKGLLFD